MNQYLAILGHAFGSSALAIAGMILGALGLAAFRLSGTARHRRGRSTHWQRAGLQLCAVLMAMSLVVLINDRLTDTHQSFKAERAAAARTKQEQSEAAYQRRMMAVQSGIMIESSNDFRQQGKDLRNNAFTLPEAPTGEQSKQ